MDLSVCGEYLVSHPSCRCDGDVGYFIQEVLNFVVASHYLHASHQLLDDDGGDSLLVPSPVGGPCGRSCVVKCNVACVHVCNVLMLHFFRSGNAPLSGGCRMKCRKIQTFLYYNIFFYYFFIISR